MEQEKPNHRIKIVPLRNRPGLCGPAAAWFSGKWGIPEAEYRRSMEGMLQKNAAVPQWYVTLGGQGEILAGAGVIENDFHNRKDLSPNLCALFVEAPCRCQGVAGMLLDFIRKDLGKLGIPVLYLVTGLASMKNTAGALSPWLWATISSRSGCISHPLFHRPRPPLCADLSTDLRFFGLP